MADFFTQLAGRTFGITPTPRPVIAPLFAPGPSLAGDFSAEVIQEQASTPTAGYPQGAPLPYFSDAARENRIHNGPRDMRNSQFMPEMRKPASEGNSQFMPEMRKPASEGNSQFMPEMRKPASEKQPGTVQKSEHTSITPRIVAEPAFPGPAHVQPQILVQGGPRTVQPARPHTGTLLPPTQVIKVSIGRIDIRAVVAAPVPALPRKAAPPSSQPSLHEYLEARNRGKR